MKLKRPDNRDPSTAANDNEHPVQQENVDKDGESSEDWHLDGQIHTGYAESLPSQGSPSHRKSAFARESTEKSSPLPIEKQPRLYRRSSVFSMLDDRPSVITLARSASHQVSKVWDRPSEYRLSVDENPERGARSEADVTPMQLQRQSHDLEQPLLVQAHDINHDTHSEISVESTGLSRRIWWAMNISLVVNVFLLIVKVYAYWVSTSKAILASAADSLVDIASQLVIAYAEYKVHTEDPKFPVGRTRLEAVGVVSCAVIMTIATIEVIQSAVYDLVNGIQGHIPALEIGIIMYIILGTASGLKVLLWLYTVTLRHTSDSMMALAEDHLNDILSNLSAIICGAVASITIKLWWADPVGAILISLYIIWSWMSICKNQVDKIVGKGAPEEFVSNLEEMANSHHDLLIVDVIRAYFFGSRFLVEMEVVLPAQMTVRESHDIALKLQHKLEGFDEVERAFVHVDYQMREEPEHKLERNLMNKSSNLFESHDSVQSENLGGDSNHGGKRQKSPD